jgi:hypothetical protein
MLTHYGPKTWREETICKTYGANERIILRWLLKSGGVWGTVAMVVDLEIP